MASEEQAEKPPAPPATPSTEAQPPLASGDFAAPTARRLHPFSWLFVLLTQLRTVAVPLVLLLFFKRGESWELWGAAGAGVLALYSLVYSFSFRYRLDSDELLVREGLLNRTERHIPYIRIQNIVQKRNPLHRLFGVTELRLESAGGSKPEAVMSVISLGDAQRIEQLLRGSPAAGSPHAEPAASETLLSLPMRDVLLIGLLGNRGTILIGALAGAGWQFDWWEQKHIRDYFRVPSTVLHDLAGPVHALGWAWTIVLAVAAFFVLLKVFSMLMAIVNFHGFSLVREGDRIATESGLLTRHGASARLDKIQRLTIGESLVARFAGRRWLSCDVAAAGRAADRDAGEQKRLKWLAPIATAERLASLSAAIDPALAIDALEWRALDPRAARRKFKPSLVLLTLGAVPAAIVFSPALAATAWVALVVLAWFQARGWARFAAYACDGRVLAFRAGWLTRQWTVARIAKGQVLGVAVSPFDRRHRMAHVKLDTAGAGSTSFALDVPYLDEGVARELAARLRGAMA